MNALEIRGLRKTYATGLEALKGIDLDVSAGDFFALLGPNGAGKSTTIGIISSLVRKSGGSISVFGRDFDRELQAVKSLMGVVPQEVNFSMFESCLDIVVNQAGYYGVRRPVALERAEKYLTKLGLWERRNEQSRNLSGGLKRRLMIARALMNEPSLLILDEPTAGVDVELRRSMWAFLLEINRGGTTILLTTHYLEEAEMLCKNIAIIDHGRILENTSMKRLLGKLTTHTFILDLDRPHDRLPPVDNYTIRQLDPTTAEVDLEQGQDMNELFTKLTQANVQIRSLRNKSSRLEELFIRIVGGNHGR